MQLTMGGLRGGRAVQPGRAVVGAFHDVLGHGHPTDGAAGRVHFGRLVVRPERRRPDVGAQQVVQSIPPGETCGHGITPSCTNHTYTNQPASIVIPMPTAVLDPLALDRQICFALAAANRSVIALYRPVLAPLGLTHPQYLVMLALWERSPRSVADLGDT